MKMNKKMPMRIFSAALASTMLLSGIAFAAEKADISGHWAEPVLKEYIDNGWLSGYGNNVYKPDSNIKRDEFAAIVNKAAGYTEKSTDISKYTDIKNGEWYYDIMAIALDAGYMKGTGKTTISPENPITREQAFLMIGKQLGYDDGTRADLAAFSDAGEVSDWAVPYVGALVRAGIAAGSNGELKPKDNMTRAQAVVTINRLRTEVNYVMMNIPYAELYAPDVNNDVKVDVFTSATKQKPRGALTTGSYHKNNDGSSVDGSMFPVKLGEGVTLADLKAAGGKQVTDAVSYDITTTGHGGTSTVTYTGANALFENPDYSYYIMRETPAYYKTVTKGENGKLVFSKTAGEAKVVSDVTAELITNTSFGDYEIDLTGIDNYVNYSQEGIYGIIISTKEGNDYGLRYLENIWQGKKLAWSVGFTDAVHNCPTHPEHYKSMMGQTITKVTYYTGKGIYEVPLNIYVPVKYAFSTAETAKADAGTIAVTASLPTDVTLAYTITRPDGKEAAGFSCNGTSVTWNGTADAGQYTLTAKDASGKYADMSDTFILETDAVPAQYDGKLTAADGVSDDTFSAYIASITSVKVNETSYSASGRNAAVIIKQDGSIDFDAKSGEANIFESGKTYQIEITASGYTKNLIFTVEK